MCNDKDIYSPVILVVIFLAVCGKSASFRIRYNGLPHLSPSYHRPQPTGRHWFSIYFNKDIKIKWTLSRKVTCSNMLTSTPQWIHRYKSMLQTTKVSMWKMQQSSHQPM